jgi:hypothetical protein
MAFLLLVQLGILAASLIAAKYLAPKPASERAAVPDEFDFPRAEAGDPIPLVYGTCRIESPVVIWVGDKGETPVERNGITIAFDYRLGMRLLLCRGNADVGATSGFATLQGMYIGDKLIPGLVGPGALTGDTDFAKSYFASEPDFDTYGLTDNVGTEGWIIFYNGSWDTERHSGHGGDEPVNPAYRGQVTARLIAWQIGSSPIVPAYSYVIHNPVSIPGYESVSGPIGAGDANPAAVIRDILANGWGGVGNEPALFDDASFGAAAATLQDEQHGCSLKITSTIEARAAIELLQKQTDGILYEDSLGRYAFRLIREDYDIEDLPVFDPSNILEPPSKPSSLWSEVFNEVKVIYTEPAKGYRDEPALAQDLARINAQGGRRKSTEYRFPGVSNAALANTLANRELNLHSRPLARLTITVNREGFDLLPGDAFVFSWPEWNGYSQVFRAMHIDYGTLTDGRITITAVQDRFAISGNVFEPPWPEVGETPRTPEPIQDRIYTEAPRWIQLKQFELGLLNSVDVQRSYSLAKPEGDDSRYKVVAAVNAGSEVQDAPSRAFPAGFTVDLAYARTTSAYDTSTGLRIRGLYGATLAAATGTQIATEGRNLIMVGAEIMAFETVTDLGGGDWLLGNVWRGVLDTAPAAHAEGDQGYLLPGSYAGGAIGTLGLVHGADVEAHTQAAAGSTWTPSEDSPEDAFEARSRTLLSYPGSDLKLGGSKTPAAVEEGGIQIELKARDRLKTTITRPDVAAETPEGGTTYDAVAVKGAAVTPGSEVLLAAGHASSSTVQVPLGAAGHGLLDVGARAKRTVSLPDGTTPALYNWQTPLLAVTAKHWRNLLINPRFTDGLTGWTTESGTATTSSTGALGNSGSFLTGAAAGGTAVVRQDVPVSGYRPANYGALLEFAVVNTGDTGDTIGVDLISVDSGGSELQTESYADVDPGAAWGFQSPLIITDLDDDTASLRVRVTMTMVGEGDDDADVGFTEAILRCGQFSDQLLTNPSFETGDFTGWTQTSGTWQVISATPYDGASYVRPNDGASAQLQQTAALPTGHELSVAVLEVARMNDAADDTGEVILEALDAGSSIVASATTGSQVISPSNAWQRRRLTITVPATATQLRVTANATRVTGTPLNSCFDHFNLRCFKELDPTEEIEVSYETRQEQALPRTVFEWKFAFPDIPAPDYAIFDGGVVGKLGVEPLMEADTGIITDGKAVIDEPKRRSTGCYENPTIHERDVHTSPIGTAFGNFDSGNDFSALAFWKTGEIPWGGRACGLMGRIVEEIGWAMGLDDTGHFVVTLRGTGGAATTTTTNPRNDGALHGGGVSFDASTGDFTTVDDAEILPEGAPGEFRATVPGRFRLMRSTDDNAEDMLGLALPGQLVRAYLWRQAVDPADLQSVIRYATHRSEWGTVTSTARSEPIACVVGTDSSGVLVETFGPDHVVQALHQATGRLGLVAMPAITNLAPCAVGTGDWDVLGGAATLAAATDPAGYQRAVEIVGDVGGGYRLSNLNLGSAGVRHLAWLARGDMAHDARIDLMPDGGATPVATLDYAVTTSWQLFTWSPTWDGSGGGVGRVVFRGSDDGTSRTIYLCPVMLITDDATKPTPGVIPIGSPGAVCPTITVAPGSQLNREGELEVELVNVDQDGTIANLHNGTNDNDRRTITWNQEAASDIESAHHNASGTSDTGAELVDTTIDEAQPYKVRLRWNRAGLVDGIASAWTALRAEQGATIEQDGGRAATFTASTTAVDVLDLGHAGGASVLSGLIFNATLRTREKKF